MRSLEMKSFRIFHTVLWRGLTYFLFLVGFLIDFYGRLDSKRIKGVASIWGKLILAAGGIKLKVNGIENIPDRTVIYMSNHQSDLDWPMLVAILPGDFVFLAKKELFELPIFGSYMKLAGHVAIDRSSPLKTIRSLNRLVNVINKGQSVLIFPEGTRSTDGKLGKFNLQSFLVAQKTGVPIIPIIINGSFKALRKGDPIIHPCEVKIKILKPFSLSPENQSDAKLFCSLAAEKTRDAILKELEE